MNRDNQLLLAAAEAIGDGDPIGAFRGLVNALLMTAFAVFLGWMVAQWWMA